MVIDTYKCIYVAVPKTGSKSIRSRIGWPVNFHEDITQIKQGITLEKFNSYYKFGFVRNPWDRAVSLYHRVERGHVRSSISFDQFIYGHTRATDTCIHPTPKVNQLDFFVDSKGHIVADYIGKFETLEQDWKHICNIINCPEVNLPHLNQSRHKHYTEYYNHATQDIIATRFAKDIEYFNYKFSD